MTANRAMWFDCDGFDNGTVDRCQESSVAEYYRNAAWTSAQGDGWTTRNGKHYCPEHARPEGESG